MSSYTHLTLNDKIFIQEKLGEGFSIRRIARCLDRSPSTISREIKRNKAENKPKKVYNPYWYNAHRAHIQYIVRRRNGKRYRLVPDTELYEYVQEKLRMFWSPEQISNYYRIKHPGQKGVSTSTIYRALKRGIIEKVSRKENLRRRGKKRQTRNANYNSIQPDRLIPQWTDTIKNRERVGDWEGDTVYGGVGKGLLVTEVDRTSRYLVAALIEKREAQLTKDTIVKMMKGYPTHSISLDNGSEFSMFRELEKELNTTVYFAEPHKPWQRGSNENMNGLLRFFFPKGFDFRSITQEEVDEVVELINHRPRKCLGWKTPHEVFYSQFSKG